MNSFEISFVLELFTIDADALTSERRRTGSRSNWIEDLSAEQVVDLVHLFPPCFRTGAVRSTYGRTVPFNGKIRVSWPSSHGGQCTVPRRLLCQRSADERPDQERHALARERRRVAGPDPLEKISFGLPSYDRP